MRPTRRTVRANVAWSIGVDPQWSAKVSLDTSRTASSSPSAVAADLDTGRVPGRRRPGRQITPHPEEVPPGLVSGASAAGHAVRGRCSSTQTFDHAGAGRARRASRIARTGPPAPAGSGDPVRARCVRAGRRRTAGLPAPPAGSSAGSRSASSRSSEESPILPRARSTSGPVSSSFQDVLLAEGLVRSVPSDSMARRCRRSRRRRPAGRHRKCSVLVSPARYRAGVGPGDVIASRRADRLIRGPVDQVASGRTTTTGQGLCAMRAGRWSRAASRSGRRGPRLPTTTMAGGPAGSDGRIPAGRSPGDPAESPSEPGPRGTCSASGRAVRTARPVPAGRASLPVRAGPRAKGGTRCSSMTSTACTPDPAWQLASKAKRRPPRSHRRRPTPTRIGPAGGGVQGRSGRNDRDRRRPWDATGGPRPDDHVREMPRPLHRQRSAPRTEAATNVRRGSPRPTPPHRRSG